MFKFFLPRLKAHFFLSSLRGAVGGWRGCHNADGLYFDYGALVVMGDRRRGVATLYMCLYKSGTQTPTSLVIPWPKTDLDNDRRWTMLLAAFTFHDFVMERSKKTYFLHAWPFGFTVILLLPKCFRPLFIHCRHYALCSERREDAEHRGLSQL